MRIKDTDKSSFISDVSISDSSNMRESPDNSVQNNACSHKISDMLAKETDGKSYKAHKFSLDNLERPQLDYESNEIIWKKTAETIISKNHTDLTNESQNINEPLLTYFLDGSRRVFKVDDIAYKHGNRSVIYPIVAGQISVGCCKRQSKKMFPEKLKQEMVLSIPDIADSSGKSGFFQGITKKLNECDQLKRMKLEFSGLLPYSTRSDDNKKFEDKGVAKIQDRMIEREKDLVVELARENKLNQNNFLVKDGSLEYNPSKEDRQDIKKYQKFKNNYRWIIGVSKSFDPEICVDVNGKSNPGFIADLPLYHRTPVACYENERLGDIQFAVWYVRLRDKKRTRTPFDGIIKCEKILVTDSEIERGMESELVNLLSAHLIAERNPVCYGSDLRWANHIYPIYLTEQFVRSKFLATESFLHLF